MKKTLWILLSLIVLASAGYVTVRWYSYLFAKTVNGKILKVEKVSPPQAIVLGARPTDPAQMFSYAIAIQDERGVIHTASSEDRQWAVVEPGKCAEAKFFVYPPWELDKAGTYFGARLIYLKACP